MKVYSEINIADFKAWGGAINTLDRIIAEDKCDELEAILEDLYPDGINETGLNDLLWFDDETVFSWLGIRTESEIRSELAEAKEELEEFKQNYADDCEDEDMTVEEKIKLWKSNYEEDILELEEKISKLEEELKNI